MTGTHYDTLQVTRFASPEVIRAAYKSLTQRWHPDRNPRDRAEAERQMKSINIAYGVLSESQKRTAYDAELNARTGTTKHSAPHPSTEQASRQTRSGGMGNATHKPSVFAEFMAGVRGGDNRRAELQVQRAKVQRSRYVQVMTWLAGMIGVAVLGPIIGWWGAVIITIMAAGSLSLAKTIAIAFIEGYRGEASQQGAGHSRPPLKNKKSSAAAALSMAAAIAAFVLFAGLAASYALGLAFTVVREKSKGESEPAAISTPLQQAAPVPQAVIGQPAVASRQVAGDYIWLNAKGIVGVEVPANWTVGDVEHNKNITRMAEADSGLAGLSVAAISVQSYPAPSKNFVRISFLSLQPPLTQQEIRDEVLANQQQAINDFSAVWNEGAPAMWASLAKSGVSQVGEPSFSVEPLGGQTALVIRYGRTVPGNPAVAMRVEQYHVVLGAEKALITLSYVDGDPFAIAAYQRIKNSIVIE